MKERLEVEKRKIIQELKQWMDPESFSRQEQLIFRDCDKRGRARIGALLSMAAAISGHDFDAQGFTYERLMEMRQVFLLSRITLQIHRHPMMGEVLTVTTWEDGCKAAHVGRNYEMADQKGDVLVSGKSDWIIVDPIQRKILRPSTFTAKTVRVCPKVIDCPDCQRIHLPKTGLTELGERRVVYSDLDCNGHLYSANYGDIIWDYLPEELQYGDVKTFAINYNKEATPGEMLRLVGCREGGNVWVEGLCGNEICFTCRCVF